MSENNKQSLRSLSSDSVSGGSKGVSDERLADLIGSYEAQSEAVGPEYNSHEAEITSALTELQSIRSLSSNRGTGGQQPVAAPIGYATAHSLAQLAIPMTSSFDVRIYRKDHFPDKTDWPENLIPIYTPTEPKAGVVTLSDHEAAIRELTVGFDRLAGAQNDIVHKLTVRVEKAEDALKQIAGIIPWQDIDMGFIDLARASLNGDKP